MNASTFSLPAPQSLQDASEQLSTLIYQGQHAQAGQWLKVLIDQHPAYAPFHRLQGGLLQHSGDWGLALVAFQRAIALLPDDSQAHTGAARCLHRQGRLFEALTHYRAALQCQCEQLQCATVAVSPSAFDSQAAVDTLWRVLAQLAAAGVHAFATSGTLLGLVREGKLLAFDKDLDIGLPFTQMEAAAALLQANGWQRKVNIPGLVNPQEWHGEGVALDLCGFFPEPGSGKVLSGFWLESAEHVWSRVTEFPDITLHQIDTPYGKVWHPSEPEAILVSLYGADWRVPDAEFDTVIAAYNMRGFSVLTQCYAFARIYGTWVLGRLDKALSLVRHALRHLPEDALLQEAQRAICMHAGMSVSQRANGAACDAKG